MDLSNFDIAHYAGHKALDELRKAYEIYTYPVGRVLSDNGIQVTSMDFKENHDIEIHASRISIRELDINIVDPVNAFHWGGYLRSLRIKEAEMCINSAIFFQVMMETSINDALGNSAKGSFSEKWKSFLIDNGASEEESGYFESYFRNIYKKIRNPTVHAKQRIGGIDASSLRFSHVHKNIRLGWFSFVFLIFTVSHRLPLNSTVNF